MAATVRSAAVESVFKEAERPSRMGSFLVVKTKTAISQNGLPRNFINQFGEHVTGILSGLDRVKGAQPLHDSLPYSVLTAF